MTKKIRIFLITIIISQLICISLFARTIEHEYHFEEPKIVNKDDYHFIHMIGVKNSFKPGQPELPSKSVKLLLPSGECAVKISINARDINELSGQYKVYPSQKQYPVNYNKEVEFTEPDSIIYNSNEPFPRKLYTEVHTQYLRGHSIAIFNICPIRYKPESGKISYYSEIEVKIETEASNESKRAFNNFYRKDKKTERRIKNIVDNDELYSLYPSTYNTRIGDNKYIIITGNSYSSYFSSFSEFKTKQGYNVLTKTTNDIYSEYSGVDNQDKIRNFIKYAYQNLGTEYILLGGDVEIVPHRGFWVNTGYGTEDYDIPADLYYAALDRIGSGAGPDWNVDNDGKWGETSEADYYPEIVVGRISADTATEFNNVLNKQMMYQQSPVVTDLEDAIMVGEELNDNPQTWGGTYKDEIMNGGSYNGYTTNGFPGNFNIQTQYERDGYWSWISLKNKMNAGTNIINHLGHSNPNSNMNFSRSNVTNNNLTSNGINHNFYLIYSQGCYSASFDNRWSNGNYDSEDCIGEKFTTISNGCVAYVGNSRYGWYKPGGTNSSSQYYDRQFFDALFGEDIFKIGYMNNDSKEDGASQCNNDPWFRWSYYCVNLFGDPSLDVWTDTPATLTPAYASSISISDNQLDIYVGVSGALVGLSQNGNHIGSGITDNSGDITVQFDNPPSVGIMDIYITAHNYNIYTGTVEVYNGGPNSYEISGDIEYFSNNIGVSNTLIELSGNANHSSYSSPTGEYNFTEIDEGYYMSQCSKTDELGGLSGMDASRIARYNVGLYSFNYDEMIAADVTLNGSITGMDASRVARYFVNLIDYLNDSCADWIFVNDWTEPWNWPPINYVNNYEYNPLDTDMLDQDFTAIRLGDVTGNWSPDKVKYEYPSNITTIERGEGETLSLPISITYSSTIEGIDIAMTYNKKILRPQGMSLNSVLSESGYGIESSYQDGIWRAVIYAQEKPIDCDEIVAEVVFDVIGTSEEEFDLAMSRLHTNELALEGGFGLHESKEMILTRAIKIETEAETNNGDISYSLYPNPSTSQATISYAIEQESQVEILLYNTRGQLIKTVHKATEQEGEHNRVVNVSDLENGIYFFKLIVNGHSNSAKLLVIK